MRRFILVWIVVLSVAGAAYAQGKFPNKDTAKDRRDHAWGTSRSHTGSTIGFGKDDQGDDTTVLDSGPKKEPVDWYDKIIITVNPDTKWPQSGTENSTTTTYDNSTDTETTTTTTKSW